MTRGTYNIVLGGEAGQGLVTVGHALAKALVRSGYRIVVTQSYYSRIRGGHNTFAVRIHEHEVQAPTESVDLLVALDRETIVEDRIGLKSDGILLSDSAWDSGETPCLKIPYKDLSAARYSNTVALGVTAYVLGLDLGLLCNLLDEQFKKKPQVADENKEALKNTFDWCSGQSSFPHQKLSPVSNPVKRLMMNGHEAVALGVASAGVKFCSFYPMTPGSSIVMYLMDYVKEMGIVVEQAEDEIAAINMAIGASFMGAPAMVATSGGGFALMEEAVSLAGVSETPIAIFIGQRPGPATGLPTRTEQADLNLALYSGHGEFPRAIFAPGTIEDCFHLARKTFEMAEKYQGPAFLLTDQFIADSYRAIDPFEIESLEPVALPHKVEITGDKYERYAITESGVSPRLLPGETEHLVVGDSHEHTEAGHITEDPQIRKAMVDKRLRKEQGMRKEIIPPEIEGDGNPDLLLLSWGSTKGAASEAAAFLRAKGTRTATIHFAQVWPLDPEQFTHHLDSAKQVISIEGNATGQFAQLIRRETGFHIHRQILRYDGRPFTPEWILRELSA